MAGLANIAAGQATRVLRVRAVENGTATAVPGAILSLLGPDGAHLQSVLADSVGEAELRAPLGVLVRVRADRVGFESAHSPRFAVDTIRAVLRVEMSARRVQLAHVVVRARTACARGGGEPTSQAAGVWEELRKALTSTALGQGSDEAEMLTRRRYVRLLTATGRVEAETTKTAPARGAGFRTASPQVLAARGYFSDEGGTAFYYAPDAVTLISSEFVRDHCFRLERREREGKVLLGLAFEPAPGRTVPDVSGALWLDQASAELRYLEYRYVHIPDDAASDAAATGRVDFTRLANGRWIVSRWHIRSPRVAIVAEQRGGGFVIPRHTEVIGFREEGGTVAVRRSPGVRPPVAAGATRGADQAVVREEAQSSVVAGFVFDSVRGIGLAGARVALDGTEIADTTDQVGHYRLELQSEGEYTLSVLHPRLAALGVPALRRPVTVTPSAPARLDLAIPSAPSISRRLCTVTPEAPDKPQDPDKPRVTLVGTVVDSVSRLPVPLVPVTVQWDHVVFEDRGHVTLAGTKGIVIETVTDSAGFFSVCGAPAWSRVRFRVGVPTERGRATESLRVGGGPLAEVTLAIAPSFPSGGASDRSGRDAPVARSRSGAIAVTVRAGRDGPAVRGAEVIALDVGRSVRTGATGEAVLENMAAGSHAILVRMVGFVPARLEVTVAPGDVVNRVVSLERATPQLAPIDVTAPSAAGVPDQFERRRASQSGGLFLDRAYLETREQSLLADVLRAAGHGVQVIGLGSNGFAAASRRGTVSVKSGRCFMQVYLDGVKIFSPSQVGNPPPNVNEYEVASLAAVEVYSGPADTPPELGGVDAACGTIVLWSRQR